MDGSIEEKVNGLVREFGGGIDPRYRKLSRLAKGKRGASGQVGQKVDSVGEALDYLRICIKYQLLDLEATRRENAYLRRLLREQGED